MKHTILTIGWDPNLINSILERIEERSDLSFQFKHLVGSRHKKRSLNRHLTRKFNPGFYFKINRSYTRRQEVSGKY